MFFQLKAIILILTLTILYIYFKVETKVRLENILNKHVQERVKDRINYCMTERIKDHSRRKNMTANYKQPVIQHETKVKELEVIKNDTDYEAMWDIAIDNWTHNWNVYREKLTDSILSKLYLNRK